MVKYLYTDYEVEAEDNGTPGSALVTRFPEGSFSGARVNDSFRAMASAIRNLGDEAFRVPTDDDDNTTPLGTMSLQNASNVSITGGILGAVRGASPVGAVILYYGSFADYTANYNTLLSFGWVIADGRTVRNPFTGANVTAPNFLGRYPKFGSNALALSGSATQTSSASGSHSHTVATGGSHTHTTNSAGSHTHDINVAGTFDLNTGSGALFELGAGGTSHRHTMTTESGHTHTVSTDSGHTHGIASASDHTHTVSITPPTIDLIPLARLF